MHFRQLEAFVNVVKLHSFSRAAEKLYLTQPTISAHISSLEDELGVQLLSRSTKDIYPSKAGIIFFDYAQEILKTRDHAVHAMQNNTRNISGSIEIAASSTPAQYILPMLLPKFSKDYPNVLFYINQCDSKKVIDKIISHDVEIGFSGTIIDHQKCIFESFYKDRLVLITPNEPRFSNLPKDRFPIELLSGEKFIHREDGSGTRKTSDSFLLNCGFNPHSLKTVAYMDSSESIKQSVAGGMGISFISEASVTDMVEDGRLLAFRNGNDFLLRDLYFVFHKDMMLSPIAELFIQFIRCELKQKK